MSQQKQAPLPRQEFQEWLENAAVPVLVLQKGKHLGSVVKVPATPEIDYLFGCETFYGERISWSDRLEFCGLYDRQHQALHLLDDPLPNFVSGLTEEECQDSTAFGKRIAQEVDRYVEAAISNERSRLSVRELTSERNINSYRYYKGTEAGREAASLFFSGEKPDVQFHSEYYTSLTEDTLLSYLKSPEDYIKTTADSNCGTPGGISGAVSKEGCVAGRVSDAQPGQRCTGLSDAGDYRCPPKKWRKDGQCHGTEERSGTDLQNIG